MRSIVRPLPLPEFSHVFFSNITLRKEYPIKCTLQNMLRVPVPFFLRTKRRALAAFIAFNVVGTYVYVWLPEKWKYEEKMRQKALAAGATQSDSGTEKS